MTVYTQFDLLLNALMYCKMYKFLNICTFTLNTIRFKRTLNVMSTEPLRSFKGKLNEIVFLLYLVKLVHISHYFIPAHTFTCTYLFKRLSVCYICEKKTHTLLRSDKQNIFYNYCTVREVTMRKVWNSYTICLPLEDSKVNH